MVCVHACVYIEQGRMYMLFGGSDKKKKEDGAGGAAKPASKLNPLCVVGWDDWGCALGRLNDCGIGPLNGMSTHHRDPPTRKMCVSIYHSDAMSKMNELAAKSNTLTKDLAVRGFGLEAYL